MSILTTIEAKFVPEMSCLPIESRVIIIIIVEFINNINIRRP